MRKEDSEQQLFSLLSFLFCIACTSGGGFALLGIQRHPFGQKCGISAQETALHSVAFTAYSLEYARKPKGFVLNPKGFILETKGFIPS